MAMTIIHFATAMPHVKCNDAVYNEVLYREDWLDYICVSAMADMRPLGPCLDFMDK